MKKFLLLSIILLIAASCNKAQNRVSIPEQNSPYVEPAPKEITMTSSEKVLGSWKRDGIDQVVTYKNDGWADVFKAGKLMDSFKWSIAPSEGVEIITEYGSPNRLYKIAKLTENELELIYQYNGQTLTYKRIQ